MKQAVVVPQIIAKVFASLSLAYGLSIMCLWMVAFPLGLYKQAADATYILPVFNTGLLFSLIACIQFAGIYERRWIGNILGGVAIGLLIWISLQYPGALNRDLGVDQFFVDGTYDHVNPYPGRLAILTALCMGLALSSILILVNLRYKKTCLIISFCFCSFIVSLSVMSIIGYVLHLPKIYTIGTMPPISIFTAIGFVLTSISMAFITYVCTIRANENLWSAFPPLVAIITLCLTLASAHSFDVYEETHLADYVQTRALSASNNLNDNLELYKHVLSVEGEYFKTAVKGKMSSDSYLLNVFNELLGVLLIEQGTNKQWNIIREPQSTYAPIFSSISNNIKPYIQTPLSIIENVNSGNPVLSLAVPLGGAGYDTASHMIVGVFDFKTLCDKAFAKKTKYGFWLRIYKDDKLFYESEKTYEVDTSRAQKALLNVGGINWTVEVIPSQKLVWENSSSVAELLLILGSLIAFLLAVTLNSFLKAQFEAEQARIANSTLVYSQAIAKMGTWKWDLLENKIWLCSQASVIFGLSPEIRQISNQEFLGFFQNDSRAQIAHALFQLKSNAPNFSSDFVIQKADGSHIYVHMDAQITKREGMQPIEVVGVIQDVNEKRLIENQLQQSSRMEAIGQLTGGLAHDFNNILMAVRGNIELLMTSILPESKEGKRLVTMYKATDRAADLTKRLLAIARHQQLYPQIVDVKSMGENLIKLLSPSLGESIVTRVDMHEGLWKVWMDPNQLETALLNLCVNARDALPNHQGTITISAVNEDLSSTTISGKHAIPMGSYVKISVTDTGVGIRPEIIDKIFDPFFTTKEAGVGTGLGLSMVYGFVTQSGGQITVYSELGVGTTINLYLPKASSMQSEATQEITSSHELVGGKETVLVVEDEAEVRQVTVDFLTSLGYKVAEAENATTALIIARSGMQFDLMFSDVIMPGGMTGPELAHEIKRFMPTIKVIFASGYPKNALGGFEGSILLTKPYKLQSLAEAIRTVLDTKKT